MSAIHVHNLCFSYTSAVPILEDVSFHLGPGWTGLVGANGAGKSTLLHLISGVLTPDSGAIDIVPADRSPVYAEQRVDDLSPKVEGFAHSWDASSNKVRGLLALDPEDLGRWSVLSPGERKRWQIGAALAEEPDVLLLDEPTNHLDATARDLLQDALGRYRGCGIVVSHDRALLNALTTRTLRLTSASVELWKGPYDTARASWTAVAEDMQGRRDQLKREQKKTSRRLADQRRKAEQKDAERFRTRKAAVKNDLDARGAAATGKHAHGQKAGAKERAVTRSRLEGLTEEIDSMVIERQRGGRVEFSFEPARKETLIRYSGPVSAGSKTLFEVDVAVRRTDRVHITGANGIGKTSLLGCLVQEATVPPDKLLYLNQETSREEGSRLVDELRLLSDDDKGRVLSLVALLGADPGALLGSEFPSPGEARKLALALGLGTPKWLLALDEPTNHLDLPSIERLEDALDGYSGALLLITHDQRLAQGATDITWVIGELGLDPAGVTSPDQ